MESVLTIHPQKIPRPSYYCSVSFFYFHLRRQLSVCTIPANPTNCPRRVLVVRTGTTRFQNSSTFNTVQPSCHQRITHAHLPSKILRSLRRGLPAAQLTVFGAIADEPEPEASQHITHHNGKISSLFLIALALIPACHIAVLASFTLP